MKLKATNVNLRLDQFAKLRKLESETGVRMAAVVRLALDRYFERLDRATQRKTVAR